MEKVLLWLFKQFSFLIDSALSWKLIGEFSFLHLILGGFLLIAILDLITFGYLNIGGTADYIGGIRRYNNRENKRDKEKFAKKRYSSTTYRIDNRTGEVRSNHSIKTIQREE